MSAKLSYKNRKVIYTKEYVDTSSIYEASMTRSLKEDFGHRGYEKALASFKAGLVKAKDNSEKLLLYASKRSIWRLKDGKEVNFKDTKLIDATLSSLELQFKNFKILVNDI